MCSAYNLDVYVLDFGVACVQIKYEQKNTTKKYWHQAFRDLKSRCKKVLEQNENGTNDSFKFY